jgi:hypothetical protein
VSFENENKALLAHGDISGVPDLIDLMGLRPAAEGRRVIVICGGAADLAGAALERASVMIGTAVARAAKVTGAVLVDGGTSAGVMRVAGEAKARNPHAIPDLVGIAPAGLVSYPGGPVGDRVPLEENHSHFILADSSEWGGETRLLMTVAEELAGPGRVLMVLAGGGPVATSEAREAARRGWPIYAIGGTGGLADSLLKLWRIHRVPRRRLGAVLLPRRLRYRTPPSPALITDPALREIIADADIRPVTGADPRSFARQLCWELQDEPVLKDAWQRFATYDHLASRLRRMFTRFQASILLLGVIATLLALIGNQVKEPALHWAVLVVPILVSVLIAVASRRAVGQRWVMLRAAAESIKAEIYRYRTRGPGSGEDGVRPAAPGLKRLAARLDVIEARLIQTEASSGPLTPYQGPLPPMMYGAGGSDDGLSLLDAEQYLRIRVGDQLSYFHGRVSTLNHRRNALQFIAIASGGIGAILAAANVEVWIGLSAGASAAALAYLGYLQVDNTIVTYNQAAFRIAALERGWRGLSPVQRTHAAFGRLVGHCEVALEMELAGWVQQMNDALDDLGHSQEDAASRIDVPGASGGSQQAGTENESRLSNGEQS